MLVHDKVVVVTGAARGIGAALARRLAAEGAAGVLLADRDREGAEAVAGEMRRSGARALAVGTDVADEDEVRAMVATAERELGPVDIMCSNAGVAFGRGIEASDAEWETSWSVNVMAHVYAARAVLPSMLDRGSGYLLHTCSAAGLLTSAGDAPYAVTKHGAVAFAEWLALTYGDAGIKTSALCPQGVRTDMLMEGLARGHAGAKAVEAAGAILEPEQVAGAVIEGLAAERFLILPHPEVAEYARRKAADRDRWLAGMRRLLRPLGA